MQRPLDYLQDPHLRARGFFRTFEQPGLDRMVTTENGPCLATGLPQPPMLPAPLQGQHTREVCREVLGMTDAEVDELVGTNALEEHPPAPAQPSA
jgi:crotonobetainyl-CoA:carnitine CoA-transferase CaiB-like acyl-CoA transferase